MKDCACLLKNSILYGIKGKQVLVPVLAMVFSLFVLMGWQKNPIPMFSDANFRSAGLPSGLKLELEDASFVSHPSKDQIKKDESAAVLSQRDQEEADIPPQVSESQVPLQQKDEQNIQIVGGSPAGDCDYSKGEWVPNSDPLYYSGRSCKRFLSSMWACRLMKRPDFSYEHYRWQPQGCDLPKFDSLKFLSRMRNKTIAFVGDSLGRQQFQSFMCMITHGDDEMEVEDVGYEYGLRVSGSERPAGWAYRIVSTSTTVLFYWSATLCNVVPYNAADPATAYAMHLDQPPFFLQEHMHKFHVLVLNTGHHWNRGKFTANKWEVHTNGSLNKDRRFRSMVNSLRFTVDSVVKKLNEKLIDNPQLQIYLRSISPRHFKNGDWNSGGTCDSLKPLDINAVKPTNDLVAESAVSNTQVKLLNVTYLSQFRGEAHISKYGQKTTFQDCLHWCLPGVPDVWNEVLTSQLLKDDAPGSMNQDQRTDERHSSVIF